MINYKKKTLKNGLRVIVAPMENTQAVTLLVLVGVGSRYENRNISGISHFLEHLFFKGTKKRPKSGQIHKELDRIGASHNAFTSKENTGFWVESAAKEFDISLGIVSDILLNPIFKSEEIEKERGVILQEINMIEDVPQKKVWYIFENILFGNQPIGWDIAGTNKSVPGIKRKDIIDYKNKNYLSKNSVIAVAGNIDSTDVFRKIEKYFSKLKQGKNKKCLKAKIFQKKPNVKIVKKDSDQTHLALGFRGSHLFDEKRYALNLLGVILGGNTSSKLFSEIREKLGLAYYVFASGDQYLDCGYLGMGAGIAHSELDRVVKNILKIIKKIKNKGVSKRDLRFAKSYIRGQMALKLEGSDTIANFCAGQEMIYKKITQPEDEIKKIEKVTQNDILKVAQDVFVQSKISLAVIGAQEEVEKKEVYFKNLFKKSL